MTKNDANALLQAAIKVVGGDGLCNPSEECGCGIDDLAPCECLNLGECQAAKWTIPKEDDFEYEDEEYRSGYYRVIE